MSLDIGRHERRELAEQSAAERLALRGEPAALTVVEPNLATELFAENAVLFAQERDGARLFAVHDAGEHDQEEAQRLQSVEQGGADGR